MPNPFAPKLTRLQNQANNDILIAFTNARAELQNISAPTVYYLELYYDGKVRRAYDGTDVETLSLSEQYRLYWQLDGLFKKAFNALTYP